MNSTIKVPDPFPLPFPLEKVQQQPGFIDLELAVLELAKDAMPTKCGVPERWVTKVLRKTVSTGPNTLGAPFSAPINAAYDRNLEMTIGTFEVVAYVEMTLGSTGRSAGDLSGCKKLGDTECEAYVWVDTVYEINDLYRFIGAGSGFFSKVGNTAIGIISYPLGWLGAIEWMRAPKNPEECRIRAVWDDDVYYMRKAVREQRCEDE